VEGEGPFQYAIPGEGGRSFLAKLSSTGELLWSVALPTTEAVMMQMEADSLGRVILMTSSHLVSVAADGGLRWTLENAPRPYDRHSRGEESSWSLDVNPETGGFVVASEASTNVRADGTDEHLLATLASRFTSEGQHLWTVRRESWVSEQVFLFEDVSMSGDQIFVLGTRILPTDAPSHVAVLRRIVDQW
jgi:hypothetical protein